MYAGRRQGRERAQRPMGRRWERRPHRERGCDQSPRGHYRDDPSTSGVTGKPALVLDRPGGIPQGYGLTSRRSVTEPRWVSSPPSYCATAPDAVLSAQTLTDLRNGPPKLCSVIGLIQSVASRLLLREVCASSPPAEDREKRSKRSRHAVPPRSSNRFQRRRVRRRSPCRCRHLPPVAYSHRHAVARGGDVWGCLQGHQIWGGRHRQGCG